MIKDMAILVPAFFLGVGCVIAISFTYSKHEVVATNGRYVGVFETGSGQAQALAFRDKATCEAAAAKLRAVVADPSNADALAEAGGKIWLMPCTPVNSELITK